jgi:hypothetical protein
MWVLDFTIKYARNVGADASQKPKPENAKR